jgi:hypothetical protein
VLGSGPFLASLHPPIFDKENVPSVDGPSQLDTLRMPSAWWARCYLNWGLVTTARTLIQDSSTSA